jgi:hypothetical protein
MQIFFSRKLISNYRCNQQITKNGILVKEFAPKDFKNIVISECNSYSSPTISDRNEKINRTMQLYSTKSGDKFGKENNECNLKIYNESLKNYGSSPIQDSSCYSYCNETQYSENCTSLNELERIAVQILPDDNNFYGCETNYNNSGIYDNCNYLNNETNFSNIKFQSLNSGYKINDSINNSQSKSNEIKTNISHIKVKNIFDKKNCIENNKQIIKSDFKRRNGESINNDSTDIQSSSKFELRR